MQKGENTEYFNSKDGKVNVWLLVYAAMIFVLSVYFVYGVVDSALVSVINMSGPNNNTNFSVSGTKNVQINCTTSIAGPSGGTNGTIYIANVTMNITSEATNVVVASNSTNSTADGIRNYTKQTISFNFTLPEGFYTANCTARANGTIADSFDALQMVNFTSNLTFRVDLSSPIIHAGESNNLSYLNKTAVVGSENRTGNVIVIGVNATDRTSGIINITLHRNGTIVNFTFKDDLPVLPTNISNNVTVINLSYVIAGSDINNVYNFTINVTDFVGRSNQTDGVLVTVDNDGSAPGPIFVNGSVLDLFNQTSSTSPVFNFTVFDNNDTSLNCTINLTVGGFFFTAITQLNVTNGSLHSNTTTGLTNGTYSWNVSCTDSAQNINTSISQRFTVDQIPPRYIKFNISGNSSNVEGGMEGLGARDLAEVPTTGFGTWAQGRRIFAFVNISDNLTRPAHADLQFFNGSSGSWQTINTTVGSNTEVNITNATIRDNAVANLSFTMPAGHNTFEGRNISFRMLVNDSLGNVNSSSAVFNITVQINDTTAPTITINGTAAVNGSNFSTVGFTASWSVIEHSGLLEVNMSIDEYAIDDDCNKFKRFVSPGAGIHPNTRRNFSFTIAGADVASTCPLGNGTHFIDVKMKDGGGNVQTIHHNFTIRAGSAPGLRQFSLTGPFGAGGWGKSNVNGSNITSLVGLNFSGFAESAGLIVDKLTYVSSCDSSSTILFNNATSVFPFNASTCGTTAANRTLTVTINDTAGNFNTTVFTFLVDNVVPSMTVNLPTNGQTFTNENITLNLSVRDNDQAISFIGYYLDSAKSPIKINSSDQGQIAGPGVNVSVSRLANHTGTHTIKFTANDTLGNTVNGSVITVTMAGPIDLLGVNRTIFGNNLGNISDLIFFGVNGSNITFSTPEINQTLRLVAEIKETAVGGGMNLTITFNGSAANWNKTDKISFIVNDSIIFRGVRDNITAAVVQSILVNNSFQDFLPDNNSYFGKVTMVLNGSNLGDQRKLYYFADHTNLGAPINITQCSTGFTPAPATALSEGTFPCWNTTINDSVDIFVPHFSVVVFANDSSPPTINVTEPAGSLQERGNQTVSMFVPNITVSPDAVSCKFIINGSAANETMEKTGKVCLGSTQRFKNLENANAYNINFTVEDSSGNINNYVVNFNVTDNTPSNTPNATRVSVSVGATTATVTISGINESVNASVQSNGSSSFTTGVQTDFNQSQAVSLTGLTASTTYNFNVTVCDFAGNCISNGTGLSFTTSAAEAAAAAAAAASSGGGGGGGGAVVSAVADSKTQVWQSIPQGSSVTLKVDKATIAVTSVAVNNVNAELKNVEIEVAALKENPVSTTPAPKVYQYIRINKKNLADADAGSFAINFRVTKAWLTENSLASADVSLYRYSADKWNELTTRVASSDSTYVNYEADTPGFSSFAIGTKSGVAVEEAPEEAPTAAPGEEAPEEAPTPVERPVPVEAPAKAPVAWLIAAVVIILGIALIVMYQKKKKQG